MIKEAISKTMGFESLTYDEAKSVMEEIMSGKATEPQIAAFLTAMRMKGETVDEITACAATMREKAERLRHRGNVLDIVGTGGDSSFTFNISTVSAFVVSAGGVPVAKHGNRSVSSKCGSADLLESLGVKIDITPNQSERILDKIGLCFMFAPTYHTSMKYAAPVRRELGVRTIFNILGPLSNPANAGIQLLGVYDKSLVLPLANVLKNLGVARAMVVHGNDGLDEITLCDDTFICEVDGVKVKSFTLNPEAYGFKKCKPSELTGGGPQDNAKITIDILEGKKSAKRDVVVLNSAVCLYLAGKGKSIEECVEAAKEIIDSGRAKKQLDRLIRLTNEVTE